MTDTNQNQSSLEKAISLEEIKLLFFHYFFDERSAGVNRVIANNIKGLQLFYPNIKPILAAGGFEKGVFDEYEKRFMNLDFNLETLIKDINRIAPQLNYVSKDAKVISGHNILRGINPAVSGAFRNFSEISDKVREYRNHDFIVRYPKDYKKMLIGVDSFGDWFPQNPEIIQTTLTTSTRRDMEIFFRGNIEIMRNSVICEDLYPRNNGKDEKLRVLLLEKGIFEEGMEHVIYAVRADERKNLEEALFLTDILSYVIGKPHKLIVTFPPADENQKNYAKEIKELAKAFEIPCSIGEAYKYIDDNNFNIGNLYRLGIPVTTAFKEGFGYAYVEPWVSEVPVVGRWIREVCEDFERNGMKLRDIFYDNSVIYSKGTPEDRMKYFGEILEDKKSPHMNKFKEFVKRVNLEERIENSKKYLKYNAGIVKSVYGHDVVARDLAKLYKLPGYEKLEKITI